MQIGRIDLFQKLKNIPDDTIVLCVKFQSRTLLTLPLIFLCTPT